MYMNMHEHLLFADAFIITLNKLYKCYVLLHFIYNNENQVSIIAKSEKLKSVCLRPGLITF